MKGFRLFNIARVSQGVITPTLHQFRYLLPTDTGIERDQCVPLHHKLSPLGMSSDPVRCSACIGGTVCTVGSRLTFASPPLPWPPSTHGNCPYARALCREILIVLCRWHNRTDSARFPDAFWLDRVSPPLRTPPAESKTSTPIAPTIERRPRLCRAGEECEKTADSISWVSCSRPLKYFDTFGRYFWFLQT